MAGEDKPLSTLVSQGWEVVSYASTHDHARGMASDNFLLRRMKSHKLLKIRRKIFGGGFTITEMDI
jgi:hypothetical protein